MCVISLSISADAADTPRPQRLIQTFIKPFETLPRIARHCSLFLFSAVHFLNNQQQAMASQPGLFYAYAKHVRLPADILNPYSHSTRRSMTIIQLGISSPFLQERSQTSGGERSRTLSRPVIVVSQTWRASRCNGTPTMEIYWTPSTTIVAHYDLGATSCLPCWMIEVVATFPLPQS